MERLKTGKQTMSTIRWMVPALAGVLCACSSPAAWKGAEAEAAYDKALEASRATAVLNNDDYYEIHQPGRIVVIADAADFKLFNATGELPLRVTRIGGGPNGETMIFDIARPESGKKAGFGSVEMYEGSRAGSEKYFYAEVLNNNQYHVFGTWAELDAFRKSGNAAGLTKAPVTGPNGEAVLVAQNADTLLARFKSLHTAQ